MARTDSFRQQHKDLVSFVKEIEAKLNPATLPANADEVRKLLSTLAGKLSVHLAMEDKTLYPAMMQSGYAEAKQTAEKFMAEMGKLAAAFKDYTQKWPSPQSITANPSGFCEQTKAVFKALSERIQREESVLYNLADQI